MAGEQAPPVATPMPEAEPMAGPRDADVHGMLMSLVRVSQTVLESAGSVALQARASVETAGKLSDTAVLVAEEAQRTIRSMREAADVEINALRRRLDEPSRSERPRIASAPVAVVRDAATEAPAITKSASPTEPLHRPRPERPVLHLMARDGWLVPTVVLVVVILTASAGVLVWSRLPNGTAAESRGVMMSAPPPRGDAGPPAAPRAEERIPERYLAPDERSGR